jgi:hypothetical protein
MTKRKNPPKFFSFEEYVETSNLDAFGLGRGVKSWDEVIGDDWFNMSDEETYERYKRYYFKKFTKLGKYLYSE